MTNIFSNFFQNIFKREKLALIKPALFFRNRITLLNFILGGILNLALWLLLYFYFRPQAEPVILHYNIYFGIDLIGPWHRIFGFSLFGLVVFFINSGLSVIIYNKEKLISYSLMVVSTLIQIILFLAGIFIIMQNL